MPVQYLARARAYLRKRFDAPSRTPVFEAIETRRAELNAFPDADIRAISAKLRTGSWTGDLLPEVFAIACVAAHKAIGLRPFAEQIHGALALHSGDIVEMLTGEGKTLAAVPAVFAGVLRDGGVHVLTANDYLARRDATWMGPIYEFLGVSVGYVSQSMTALERRRAYACDVTYATANEVGFDFLRDHLALDAAELVQREFQSAIIDEADSLLIDEARIPLVIAGGDAAPEALARRAASLVAAFDHRHYVLDEHSRNVQLSYFGAALVEQSFACGNLYEEQNLAIHAAVLDALHAQFLLRRDIDYVVRNGAVELIDEFKGRVAQDRRWPAGLQTALEAREGLPLHRQGRVLSSITLQNLFAQYPRIAGMTGTAETQAQEFRDVYRLPVSIIRTHRPMIRPDYPDRLFRSKAAKNRAVLNEIFDVHTTGRPILVGTASVEESERLSALAREAGIPHRVLNARNDEAEAAIISEAGALGAVTISTNMAGRGTDIRLGGSSGVDHEKVVELGGLYVIGTNRHESRRIDNQLRGRAGRQGDPGASRFFLSLQDDLISRYGIADVDFSAPGAMDTVQRLVEMQNLEIRRTLWKYDGLIEHQRRQMYDLRRELLSTEANRERRIRLAIVDDLWADYLAAVAELRHGIHWHAWAGRDPLNEFLHLATDLYKELQDRIAEETETALARDDLDLSALDGFDRGATWTYLINDNPFGTLTDRLARGLRRKLADWNMLR